jgi:hypothetical protein
MQLRPLTIFASILLLLTVSVPSEATILFDSGPPNGVGGLSIVGAPPNEVASAARFTTSGPWQVASVKFWSLELSGYVWDGTIKYFVFPDVGGSPASSPLVQGSAIDIVQVADSAGSCCNASSSFRYTFNLASPATLSANTAYWLALQIGRGISVGQSFWSSTNLTPITNTAYSQGATFNNWILSPQSGGLAFQLSDTAIPEPSTVLLMGGGLIGLAWRRRF